MSVNIGPLLRGDQLPTNYAGDLDASTGSYPNNPIAGNIYTVTVAGTIGPETYEIGDTVLFDGTDWVRVGSSGGAGGLALTLYDASTGVYPSNPSSGDGLVITTAGTISGIDYVVGDTVLFNGTDWVTISVDANVVEWNVTPNYTPASVNPFSIDVPASTDVIVSGVNSDIIQPDQSGVVGPVANDRHVAVAVLDGTISTANRLRMNATVNSFTQTGSGELQVYIGLTDNVASLSADLTLLSDDNIAVAATHLFATRLYSTNNTTFDRTASFFLTNIYTPGQPKSTGANGSPAATGTLSFALSNFTVGTVGVDADGLVAVYNGEASSFGIGQFGSLALAAAALNLTPFFAIVSSYNGSAWSTANVTIEPFPATPEDTITPGATGLPQAAFDEFVTGAVGAGNSIPESYVQVSAFPPNTKTNDVLKARVDAFAGDINRVQPLNGQDIIIDDELLLVTNAASGSEEFVNVSGRSLIVDEVTGQVPHRVLNVSNSLAANGDIALNTDDYRIYKTTGSFSSSLDIFDFAIPSGYFEYNFEGGLTLSQNQNIRFRLSNTTAGETLDVTVETNSYDVNPSVNKPTITVDFSGTQQAIYDRTLNSSFGNAIFGIGLDLDNNTFNFIYNDADNGVQTLAIDYSALPALSADTNVNFQVDASRARNPIFVNTGSEPYTYPIPAGLSSLPNDSINLGTSEATLTMSTTLFDPLANAEITGEQPGTLQRVITSGEFNNNTYTRGHYALWDGTQTLPFPQPTVTAEQSTVIPLYGGENISLDAEDIIDGMTFVQTVNQSVAIEDSTISLPFNSVKMGTRVNVWVQRPGTVIMSGAATVSPFTFLSNMLNDTTSSGRISTSGITQFVYHGSTWVPVSYNGPAVRVLSGGSHTVGDQFDRDFDPINHNTRYYFASTSQTATVTFDAIDGTEDIQYSIGDQLHFDHVASGGTLNFVAGTATVLFANGRSSYSENTQAVATYMGNNRWLIDGTNETVNIPNIRQTEVLLQPGGTPDPLNHIYDNWTDAYNACVAIAGPVTMKVDTAQSSTSGSITILSNNFQSVRTAVVPTGTWALRPNEITIEGVHVNEISNTSGSETISTPVGLGFTDGAFLDQVGEIKNITFHVNKTLSESTILSSRTISESGNGIPYNHFTNCKFLIQNTESSVIQTSDHAIGVIFEGDFLYCDNSDNSTTNINSALVSGIIGDFARIAFRGSGEVLHYTGWPSDDPPRFANNAQIDIDNTRDPQQMRQLLSEKTTLGNTTTGSVTIVQLTSDRRIEAGTVGTNSTYISNANEMQWQTDYSNITNISAASTYLLPTRTTSIFSPSALPVTGQNYYVRSAGWDITFFINVTTGTLTITPPSGNTINGAAGDLIISSTGIQQVLVKFNANTNDFVVKVI